MRPTLRPALLVAIALLLSGASQAVTVTMQNDDGTAETFVEVDSVNDLARKTFTIPQAQFATIVSAQLHIVAKASLCAGTVGNQKLTLNGQTLALFDPCTRWAEDVASVATFDVTRIALRPGENRITMVDNSSRPNDHAALYAVDLDHDYGATLAYSNYGPAVRGELLWSLVLEQLAEIVTVAVRDADSTPEDFVDFDYVDDRAEKVLVVPPGALEGGRSAQLMIYAAAQNCAPGDLPGTQTLVVDGIPTVTFDPCALWRGAPAFVGLPLPLTSLHEGPMTFSLDDSGVTWTDAGLLLGVDTDHDMGRSTMLGSHVPQAGELMWSLEISKANAQADGPGDASGTA